jgi:hypothetical protein
MDSDERDVRGPWMQTSLGGRWYPGDPRPSELLISNIANGLAQEYRYGGGGDIYHLETVAEHSYKLWWYVMVVMTDEEIEAAVPDDIWGTVHTRRRLLALAMLLHDVSEGTGLRDMVRAWKRLIAEWYKPLEKQIMGMVWRKHNLAGFVEAHEDFMKALDDRIIANEYPVVMRYKHQPWTEREPLPRVMIECWPPVRAKQEWINAYKITMRELEMPILEVIEI